MLNANLIPRVIDGDWEISTGYRIGSEVDFVEKGITAVFIANDRMALGFLHAMRQRGISIPGQLSVIGFDDLEESQYAYPPLTTVRQDFRALGERAMQLLLLEIKGNAYKKLDRLIPELVVRGSTARLTAL
jgi:DNA-binding LacI/PurR family transcriptional regulator